MELEIADQALKNYNLDIAKKIFKPLINKHRLLDFGAGIGTFSMLCRDLLGRDPSCCEVDQQLIEVLKSKNFGVTSTIDNINTKYDGIFSLNVLEHIENDGDALIKIHNSLCEDGILCLYLPAFPILYSELDLSLGHYRRYTKKDITEKLKKTGFKITKLEYVDSVGFFISLLVKIFGYNSGLKLGNVNNFRRYDLYIYPISRCLDYFGLKKYFGKNIIIQAYKI
jgi:2-polyprenyl-3-methyl-5-hydroxy-6-metoxy-1,4-benzoquinol methylase